MRSALPVILLSLLLGACAAAPDRAAEPPAEEDTITATVLADPTVAPEAGVPPDAAPVAVPVADATPMADDPPERTDAETDPAPSPESAPPPLPPALAAEARACAEAGGTLRPRGRGGLWSCVRLTRDGGRTCSRGGDCEGECLARSRSCAPLEPLFGCHDVLDGAGRRQTLCRE
jgi:hypothetical protein